VGSGPEDLRDPHSHRRDGPAALEHGLTGTAPRELPVELSDRIEFVISLKTARRLALPIPEPTLRRADRLIDQHRRDRRTAMKAFITIVAIPVFLLGGAIAAAAADMKDSMKVEVSSVGLHPGLEPGMYVCALGHLHVKGTVQNPSAVPVGRVEVAGKAFDASGQLPGPAMGSTKDTVLKPNAKAGIDLEFLTVAGPRIQQVKNPEIAVIEAPAPR
jgi:hypothetical protein